jgi:hypothetical protein
MIRKVLFLIGNRHFLIRKCHFGIGDGSYVERGQYANETSLHFSGAFHDPPPPSRPRHRHRFRRPRRLRRRYCAQPRRVPDCYRLVDLQVSELSRAAAVALRGSER